MTLLKQQGKNVWIIAAAVTACSSCAPRTSVTPVGKQSGVISYSASGTPQPSVTLPLEDSRRARVGFLMADGPQQPVAPLTREAIMGRTFEIRHISVSIDRPPQDVYAFISDGETLATFQGSPRKAMSSVSTCVHRTEHRVDCSRSRDDRDVRTGASVRQDDCAGNR